VCVCVRRKYVCVFMSCHCYTVQDSNLKERASKSFDNMSVSQSVICLGMVVISQN